MDLLFLTGWLKTGFRQDIRFYVLTAIAEDLPMVGFVHIRRKMETNIPNLLKPIEEKPKITLPKMNSKSSKFMIHKFVPVFPFANGDNAFKKPGFWYRYVGHAQARFGDDYYLFPFNLIERFRRWRWDRYVKAKEKTY